MDVLETGALYYQGKLISRKKGKLRMFVQCQEQRGVTLPPVPYVV
jgi:hypothetical protein